jgi:hypothetical protein
LLLIQLLLHKAGYQFLKKLKTILMADKQTGTGAKGRKQSQARGNDQSKNPVSAKNQSKQKNSTNRSASGGNSGRSPNNAG